MSAKSTTASTRVMLLFPNKTRRQPGIEAKPKEHVVRVTASRHRAKQKPFWLQSLVVGVTMSSSHEASCSRN